MLLLLSFLLSNALAPRSAEARLAQAPPAAQSDADAYAQLDKEFIARWSAYDDALREAREKGVPQADWPKSPQLEFYPRFEAFAKQGNPRAIRWCIQFAAGGNIEQLRESKLMWYGELVARFADEDWMVDVLRDLRGEVSTRIMSVDDVESVCIEIAQTSKKRDLRAAAIYNAGLTLGTSTAPGHAERGTVWLEKLIAEYPDTESATRAKSKLFQLRYLQVGLVAPDFVTTDVDGVEFKLSDYRGKVVVLDFWGFW